jgi:putative cell wall-binding protein
MINATPEELTKATKWWIDHQQDTMDLMKNPNICLTYQNNNTHEKKSLNLEMEFISYDD